MVDKPTAESVLGKFISDVKEHVRVILDEIQKGNRGDALLFLEELARMRDSWRQAAATGPVIIVDWARGGTEIDASESKRLAKLRADIADAAINQVKKSLQDLGWIS